MLGIAFAARRDAAEDIGLTFTCWGQTDLTYSALTATYEHLRG